MLYEHAITVGQEIDFIWSKKLSWMSAFYLVNRYGLFASQLILFFMQYKWAGLTDKVRSYFPTATPLSVHVAIEVRSVPR